MSLEIVLNDLEQFNVVLIDNIINEKFIFSVVVVIIRLDYYLIIIRKNQNQQN